MKKLIVLLAVVAFVASVAVAFAADAPSDAIVLKGGNMGAVTFNHAGAGHAAQDCTACHHNGVDKGKCTSCHGVDAAAPKAKKAFHDQCKGCHKAEKAGPTKCKECHVK